MSYRAKLSSTAVYVLRLGGGGTRRIRGWRRAVVAARRLARRSGFTVTLGLPGMAPTTSVHPNGRVQPFSGALGDVLTEFACDQAAYAQSWRARLNDGLDTGAQAALVGAATAGLLGGLLKRPLLGAAVGAVAGWGAHAIWTAPARPE